VAPTSASARVPLIDRVTAGAIRVVLWVNPQVGPGVTCTGAICATLPPGCQTVGTADVSATSGDVHATDNVPLLRSPPSAAIGLLGGGIASVPDDGNFVFVVAQVDGTVARVDALVAGGATDSTRPSDGLVVLAGRAPSAIRDPTMALTATTIGGATRTVTWGGPGTDWADCAPQNATTG
jgi:hypothetical protein